MARYDQQSALVRAEYRSALPRRALEAVEYGQKSSHVGVLRSIVRQCVRRLDREGVPSPWVPNIRSRLAQAHDDFCRVASHAHARRSRTARHLRPDLVRAEIRSRSTQAIRAGRSAAPLVVARRAAQVSPVAGAQCRQIVGRSSRDHGISGGRPGRRAFQGVSPGRWCFRGRAMLVSVLDSRSTRRLAEASKAAWAAEARGEAAVAGEAWRRYRLIRDASREPDELLAEGIALSQTTIEPPSPGRMPR